MTHPHQHPAEAVGQQREGPNATSTTAPTPRPRWLVPGLVIGVVAVALVVFGVLSASTVLYAGLIGGMVLMHLGGHGGHGDHAGHGRGSAPSVDDLRDPSLGAQVQKPDSSDQLEDRALRNGSRSEQHDEDQHNNHGCH